MAKTFMDIELIKKHFPTGLLEEAETAVKFCNVSKRIPPEPYFPQKLLKNADLGESDILYRLKPAKTIAVYIHIPFCDRKCHFCDLYSFCLPENHRKYLDTYVSALVSEMYLWQKFINTRSPVISTIHFGGGSPLILSEEHFSKLFEALNQLFQITAETEPALEMTTSDINDREIGKIVRFGFRRIHVGVQTLNNKIRKLLGRKESSAVVTEKLEIIRKNCSVLSADILCGLPEQTFFDFTEDLGRFISLGMDGYALYELTRTRNFENRYKDAGIVYSSPLEKYFMFLIAKEKLNRNGFQNVFFNHFGNKRDNNLYFTYPVRGEDCLAFGAIADGRTGGFYYRNLKLRQYIEAITGNRLPVDCAYFEEGKRIGIRRMEEELMSATISEETLRNVALETGESIQGVADFWESARLIKPVDKKSYELTGSGCWFLSGMMEQLRRFGQP